MYRTSNSNTYTGKTELSKSFLIFTGEGRYLNSLNSDWQFMKKVQGNARVYFSKFLGQLSIFKKPLSEKYYNHICVELDKHKVDNLHPSLTEGFNNELKRLFPKASPDVVSLYHDFIKFLENNYQINKNHKENKLIYCDDIGPYITTRSGLKISIIPELPQLYMAPEKWRKMTWSINNFFIGPYPENEKGVYYSRGDNFDIGDLIQSKYDEGTILFLISKFIIIQEAWMDRSSCDSLRYFIDLVVNKNIKPT